jgi:hypothetical protein
LAARQAGETDGAQTKTIRLDLARVNAWLATRFPHWLANQDRALPANVGRVMLGVEAGKPVLAFAYYPTGRSSPAPNTTTTAGPASSSTGQTSSGNGPRPSGSPQIVSLVFEAGMQPDGKAQVRLAALRLGQLPLPRSWAVDRVRQQLSAKPLNAEQTVIKRVLDGKPFDPQWQLDTRQVRLINLTIEQDHVALTFRHEPADS